jgi:DNA-binding CsgD family transcriptional regulator
LAGIEQQHRQQSAYVLLGLGTAFIWLCLNAPAHNFAGCLATDLANLAAPALIGVVAGGYLLITALAIICIFSLRHTLKARSKPIRLAVHIAIGAIGCVGLSVLWLDNYGQPSLLATPTPLSAICLFASVLFLADLLAIWGDALSQLPQQNIPLIIAFSCAASDLLRVAASLTGLSAIYPIAALCAALCLIPLSQTDVAATASESRTLRAAPWRIIICSIVLLVLWTLVMRMTLGGESRTLSMNDRAYAYLFSAGALAATGLFLKWQNTKKAPKRVFLYPFVAIVLAYMAGLAGMLVFSDAFIAFKIILITAEHCLEVFVMILLAYHVREKHLSSSSIFAIFALLISAAHLFDMLDASILVPAASFEPAVVGLSFATAVVLIVFLLSYASTSAPASAVIDEAERQRQLCSAAAAGSNLTARELDVMVLMYRGYSSKRIAEELFVSDNTVRTHASSIYRKLGVHSKQDLMSLVDGFRETL